MKMFLFDFDVDRRFAGDLEWTPECLNRIGQPHVKSV